MLPPPTHSPCWRGRGDKLRLRRGQRGRLSLQSRDQASRDMRSPSYLDCEIYAPNPVLGRGSPSACALQCNLFGGREVQQLCRWGERHGSQPKLEL